jgi:hypothetical protein
MTRTAGTWVEAMARRYGVGQVVRFLEKLPEGEYFRLMVGAGATVLPSIWHEPLPTVAVESVSLGFRWWGRDSAALRRSWIDMAPWRRRCRRR